MTVFDIVFYYDTICPWCYIAYRTLTHAISLYQKTYPNGSSDAFTITFHPFYLQPKWLLDLNSTDETTTLPIREAISTKNGETMARGIETRLARLGKLYGIDFRFDGKIGRSGLSHRVLWLLGREFGKEVQERSVVGVMRSVFEEGGDVTDRVMLEAVIKESIERDGDGDGHSDGDDTGDGGAVERIMEMADDDDVKKTVDEMAMRAREQEGVKHVPTLVINGVKIEGSEEVGGWFEVLVRGKEGELQRSAIVADEGDS